MNGPREYTATTHDIADRIESGDLHTAKIHLRARIPEGEQFAGQPTALFARVSLKELRREDVVVRVSEFDDGSVYIYPTH